MMDSVLITDTELSLTIGNSSCMINLCECLRDNGIDARLIGPEGDHQAEYLIPIQTRWESRFDVYFIRIRILLMLFQICNRNKPKSIISIGFYMGFIGMLLSFFFNNLLPSRFSNALTMSFAGGWITPVCRCGCLWNHGLEGGSSIRRPCSRGQSPCKESGPGGPGFGFPLKGGVMPS